MPTIREILNKIKWCSEGGLSDCEVEILHRGAPNDRRVIRGMDIKDIAPRAIIYRGEGSNGTASLPSDDDEEVEGSGEEVVIPYHRVRAIRKGSKTLWEFKRREKKKDQG